MFAWRLFAARPPTVLKRLSHADREDRIADLVLSCCEWDFRRLRKYRDIGKPFAAWLTILLVNQTLDWLRSRKPFPEILEAKRAEEKDLPEPLPATIRTCIHRCLSRMGAKCQLYLACLADGMRPREIAVLVLLPEDNKRIADDLRYCLRKLRMMLIEEGLDPGKIVLE